MKKVKTKNIIKYCIILLMDEPNVHSMKLQEKYFDEIARKMKRYEARIFDEKRKSLKLLDIIEFTNEKSGATLRAQITELSFFKKFRDGLISKDYIYIVPGANSLDAAEQIYMNLPGYETKETEMGTIFIKFELLE